MNRPRSPKTATLGAFDAATVPIYLLDRSGRVLYINGAATRALEMRPEDLVGRGPPFRTSQDAAIEAAVERLSPPPEVWQGAVVGIRLPCPDDHWEMEFIPLPTEEDTLATVLAVGRLASDTSTDPRLDSQRLREELFNLRRRIATAFHIHPLIGRSAACRRMRRQVELAANCHAHVLLIGPRGSGREAIARAIHEARGIESSAPLVPLDCALLDAELLQSTIASFLQSCAELELPGIPTLLLLDVDRMDPSAQTELMEVLTVEELAIRVLATYEPRGNPAGPAEGILAELWQTLSEFMILVVPLCERREDIPLLAQHLVAGSESGSPPWSFEVPALESLAAHDWPQGLPELAAVVEAAAGAATPPTIRFADLPPAIRHVSDPQLVAPPKVKPVPLDAFLEVAERQQIAAALRKAKGNKARAARLLGISRARLIRRVAHFQLEA